MRPLLLLLVAASASASTPTLSAQEPEFDLVVRGGRVMDPETGYDWVADVGVRGDRVATIGGELGPGKEELDATGRIVAPGFVDVLGSVPPNKHAHAHKITDGVTTSFGMHGGPIDVEGYTQAFEASGALVNYGAVVGHSRLREATGVDERYSAARPEQISKMREIAGEAIRNGASGIGFGINYTPGATYEEVFALFEVAAEHDVPVHLHARYKGNVFPLTMSLAAIEVVAMAAASGAQAQLAHLSSSTVGSMPLCLKLVEGAQARGVDVGFDFHVWTRNQTGLKTALYDDGWQERFGGATYSDIYVSATQERLTKERFEELRAQEEETSVQTEFIPEEEIEMAIRSPYGIVSSDSGGLFDERGHEYEMGHPRGTGTFARFLGRYVRERRVVGWMEGIRKITLLPARRLERAVPSMKNKGRLQVGADADIVVFDPGTIVERATYQEPYHYSQGIDHVIVNGVVALRSGELVSEVSPGRWMSRSTGGR